MLRHIYKLLLYHRHVLLKRMCELSFAQYEMLCAITVRVSREKEPYEGGMYCILVP